MSWKNVKEHYRIGHQVQIREGCICIGSAYISDLIRVAFDGTVTWGKLGPARQNDDLLRYYDEMTESRAYLRELIARPDTFTASIPVYTYDGGNIIEKQCEALGWPNCTHDGLMMYENTFSTDKAKIVAIAKRNAACGVKMLKERIVEEEKRMDELRRSLASDEADLAKLNADYPNE